jgi:hypothetical protein
VRNAKISTREHVKNFLGMILALADSKTKEMYMEHLFRSKMFEFKCMRSSLFNEILLLSKQEKTIRRLSMQYLEKGHFKRIHHKVDEAKASEIN